MSNTYRKNREYGEKETLVRDSSDEYKWNRNYRKNEKDYIISSLQSDLINTRNAGKESLRNAGFKVRTRMNYKWKANRCIPSQKTLGIWRI
jgi:hypothetical protein